MNQSFTRIDIDNLSYHPCMQIKHEDIYSGLGVYAKPATAESDLYAQLKAFHITNIPHNQIRYYVMMYGSLAAW